MSSWPLQQRYGSGAARILLPAAPVRRGVPVAAFSSRADPFGALLVGSLVALSFGVALHRLVPPLAESSDLRIVWFEPEQPVPVVELAPQSRPAVQPVRVAAPKPLVPEPVRVVRVVPTPAPPPVTAHPVPAPTQIDSLAALQTPPVAASTEVRVEPPRAAGTRERAPVHFDLPVAAAVRGDSRPAIAGRRSFELASLPRSSRPAQLSLPSAPPATPLAEHRTPAATERQALRPLRAQTSAPVGIAMPGISRSIPHRAIQQLPAVAAAPPGPAAAAVGTAPAAEAALRGVSLGTLAACRSDRREDLLKQRVIASVTTRKQCASDAGNYRFIETRNLNAFLMWVDRNPMRPEANRCGELELALDCLKDGNGKETRTP